MTLEVVRERKILECADGEKVIIFSTGGRRFTGRSQIPGPGVLSQDGYWYIHEVYELLSFQGIIPGKIQGASNSISVQTMLMYPDLGANLGEPIEEMAAKVDWFYAVSDDALGLIRQNIQGLGHR